MLREKLTSRRLDRAIFSRVAGAEKLRCALGTYLASDRNRTRDGELSERGSLVDVALEIFSRCRHPPCVTGKVSRALVANEFQVPPSTPLQRSEIHAQNRVPRQAGGVYAPRNYGHDPPSVTGRLSSSVFPPLPSRRPVLLSPDRLARPRDQITRDSVLSSILVPSAPTRFSAGSFAGAASSASSRSCHDILSLGLSGRIESNRVVRDDESIPRRRARPLQVKEGPDSRKDLR